MHVYTGHQKGVAFIPQAFPPAERRRRPELGGPSAFLPLLQSGAGLAQGCCEDQAQRVSCSPSFTGA